MCPDEKEESVAFKAFTIQHILYSKAPDMANLKCSWRIISQQPLIMHKKTKTSKIKVFHSLSLCIFWQLHNIPGAINTVCRP